MTYDEPLLSGTALLVVWAVVGALFALALTVAVLLRKAPPLTTQVDHSTGVKHHGILLWFGGFLLIGAGPPMAILLVRAVMIPAVWLVEHWWILALVAVVGSIAWGARYLWVRERADEWAEEEQSPPVPQQQLTMWTAPTYTGQWNQPHRVSEFEE